MSTTASETATKLSVRILSALPTAITGPPVKCTSTSFISPFTLSAASFSSSTSLPLLSVSLAPKGDLIMTYAFVMSGEKIYPL